MQIYHLSTTDTEQIAWCLDVDSNTVCVRTPLVFSVLLEALSVDNPCRATITDRSYNIVLNEEILKKFLSERKTSMRSLSISTVEAIQLSDIYFFQGGFKKPYLRVWFSAMKGFNRFRNLFQGSQLDTTPEQEITNDTELEEGPRIANATDEEPSATMKQHGNVMLVTEGVFARFRILEVDIQPYWHWLIKYNLRAASTIVLPPEALEIAKDDPMRVSKADREYLVSDIKLSPGGDIVTHPKVLSWDIESLSKNPARFPNACALPDVAFFISAYIKRYGDPDTKSRRVGIYLVDSLDTLGLTEPRLADGTELVIVDSEAALLDEFWNLIREENPQILIGYNTMGFDSRYLHYKMSLYQKTYPNLSLMRDEHCANTNMRQFSWSSSAYKAVECWYYDTPGMLVLDMFVELKRDALLKLKAYTLDAVSEHFMKEHKVDLKAKEMFNIYLEYQRGVRNDRTRAEMRRIAEYGMQDAVLPARLFDLRTQWIIYTQMACIMGLGIMDLITRGQTLRTKANIYRMCRQLGFAINVPRDKPTYHGKFRGAYVCQMVAGLYDDVIVYDFASLYPSIISAFNLCYSTFIHRRNWHLYPPELYNAFQVTIPGSTASQEVRFVKASVFKGITPRVVEGFLAARAATRERLAETTDPIMRIILNQQQLAIKVSNNSVYGAMSADFARVIAAYMSDICGADLGLKWIGMTVTEIGQTLIKGCTSFLEKNHGAVPVYGDTDSTFFTLPPLPPFADGSALPTLWQRAKAIEKQFNATLPPPLSIELEKIIRMIGLTAKRYIYREQTKDGVLKAGLNYKGVVATRRDTCKWQVELFSAVCEGILQDLGKEQITKIIYKAIVELVEGRVPLKSLLIGCSVAESYKAATSRMAVLKQRMAELGRPIAGGSRVEFFITQTECPPGPMDIAVGKTTVQYRSPYLKGPRGGLREDNVSSRVRMIDEFVPDVTKIDYVFYVGHMAQKSIDQLFAAAYHGDMLIEPLLHGLYFNTSQTLAEMKMVIGHA